MNRVLWLMVVLLVPSVMADTLTEDFDDFVDLDDIGAIEGHEWYVFSAGAEIYELTELDAIGGTQSLKVVGNVTSDSSNKYVNFQINAPAQLTSLSFQIEGIPPSVSTDGSRQVISIESSAPVRTLVQFYVFCNDSTNTSSCELKVRYQHEDSTGQTLINGSLNQTLFKIEIVPDWINSQFTLYVDDINDGDFPFLELPIDIGRVKISQYNKDVPIGVIFDNWTLEGATDSGPISVEGDAVSGILNFAEDIRFTTTGSKFFLGFLIFVVLCAAVIVPLLALGFDNTIVPAIGFFVILVALWLVEIEFWPDWVGISFIILVAALVSTVIRRLVMGMKDARNGPGLVAGSLGYFIIATSLLAFSGYASETISLPTGSPTQQGVNETENPDQTFVGAVLECSLHIVTFTGLGDCSQKTVTTTWKAITDVFGWVQSGLNFLFQLLTFQLPIPVIFSAIIVLPPAIGLFTFAVQTIRGVGS